MEKKNNLAKSATMIALFTLISKGMGFLREIMIAYKYGSGMKTDTYFAAMTATVLIMGTIGAALNTTLIPIFSEIRAKGGKNAQKIYLNNMLNIVFLITVAIAIFGYIFSPLIIKVLAKGFEGEQFDLAVKLNRIGMPIVILLGFTYVLSGYLQSNEIFGPHAIMGIPYNLVFLMGLLFFVSSKNIQTLMVISVLATLTQVLIQVPAVLNTKYRYKPRVNLKDPYLKKALILVMPVLLGSAVSQINVIIDKTLASELVEGSMSALVYASRINEMIISVFVAAIATVVFPMLSKAFSNQDIKEIRAIFKKGVNIILLITVPATVGIMLLGEDLVRIFFERKAFDARATMMTSGALFYYSIGLIASALRLMLNKMFYSFQDTRTPMINGAIAVIINVILNLFFIRFMGHTGLALATSLSAIVTTILLFIDLRSRIGKLGLTKIALTFIKVSISSAIMGVVVYLLYFKVGALLPDKTIVELLSLIVSVAIGMITYFLLCIILKVEELGLVLKIK
ncbi:murein biosynthesis integral membrane protein MurJ [Tissierella creatinophila]|uniref:Probable lipid II flippase MurJ n=1 Tax=Tissierella creatinophila DSM 6911 TaxID=1123403 RepID=A0A1U7M4M9_TISCR|nr:murein biosynthesis integral membrane protein MurJ [Tissierella creatinophila]OLS02267.1 putative peptidoglycan biosynthesis protein MurJ [Tissierella creatinophila DSM 6911]